MPRAAFYPCGFLFCGRVFFFFQKATGLPLFFREGVSLPTLRSFFSSNRMSEKGKDSVRTKKSLSDGKRNAFKEQQRKPSCLLEKEKKSTFGETVTENLHRDGASLTDSLSLYRLTSILRGKRRQKPTGFLQNISPDERERE